MVHPALGAWTQSLSLPSGAAIGEATLGKKAKARAALVGGVVASLPDLDVFYPFANQVSAFTWHRGITHSLLVLALVAPLVAWLLNRTRITSRGTAREWRLLVFLALLTHPLLDAFTVYGTQLLWPIPMPPVTWSTLFIIDPIVTLVLISGVVGARLTDRWGKDSSTRICLSALCLMVTYVVWSIVARLQVDRVAHQYLRNARQPGGASHQHALAVRHARLANPCHGPRRLSRGNLSDRSSRLTTLFPLSIPARIARRLARRAGQ